MASGNINIVSVAGDGPYTLTLSSGQASALSENMHVYAARTADTNGGAWRVSAAPVGDTVQVTDDLPGGDLASVHGVPSAGANSRHGFNAWYTDKASTQNVGAEVPDKAAPLTPYLRVHAAVTDSAGGVGKSGTPTANQIATWADANQIQGSDSYTITGNAQAANYTATATATAATFATATGSHTIADASNELEFTTGASSNEVSFQHASNGRGIRLVYDAGAALLNNEAIRFDNASAMLQLGIQGSSKRIIVSDASGTFTAAKIALKGETNNFITGIPQFSAGGGGFMVHSTLGVPGVLIGANGTLCLWNTAGYSQRLKADLPAMFVDGNPSSLSGTFGFVFGADGVMRTVATESTTGNMGMLALGLASTAYTASDTLENYETCRIITNQGAGSGATATLPGAVRGLHVLASRVATQTFTIAADAADSIVDTDGTGGNSQVQFDADDEAAWLVCFEDTVWTIMNKVGTPVVS